MTEINASKLGMKATRIIDQINDSLNISETCSECFTVGDINGCSNYYGATEGRERSGCCGLCAESNGYFPSSTLVNYMKMEYNFDDKYGFLGEFSCNIPREKRSRQCNSFLCRNIKDTKEYTSMLRLCSSVVEECNRIIAGDSKADYSLLKVRESIINGLLEDGISSGRHILYC